MKIKCTCCVYGKTGKKRYAKCKHERIGRGTRKVEWKGGQGYDLVGGLVEGSMNGANFRRNGKDRNGDTILSMIGKTGEHQG